MQPPSMSLHSSECLLLKIQKEIQSLPFCSCSSRTPMRKMKVVSILFCISCDSGSEVKVKVISVLLANMILKVARGALESWGNVQ